jgi:hypothetical protein
VRELDQQALVDRLAGEFPVFARSTIVRWVAQEVAKHRAARIADHLPLVEAAVRATMAELSREGVTTSVELPVARPGVSADDELSDAPPR